MASRCLLKLLLAPLRAAEQAQHRINRRRSTQGLGIISIATADEASAKSPFEGGRGGFILARTGRDLPARYHNHETYTSAQAITSSPPWTTENGSSKVASVALRGRGGWIRCFQDANWIFAFIFCPEGAPAPVKQKKAGAIRSPGLFYTSGFILKLLQLPLLLPAPAPHRR